MWLVRVLAAEVLLYGVGGAIPVLAAAGLGEKVGEGRGGRRSRTTTSVAFLARAAWAARSTTGCTFIGTGPA